MDDPVYVRDSSTLWRGVIGGVLILPPGSHESWFVTAPGDVIWDLLVEPRTINQLVDALSIAFDEHPSIVLTDIEPVVRTLYDIGAVRTC